jgi:glutamate carboxypeptidase
VSTATATALAARLRQWVEIHRAAIVEELVVLAGLDAPSGERLLLEQTAALLSERLQQLGGAVTRHETPVGPHLAARFGPDSDAPPVLVLCHYDTVWAPGTGRERPPRLEAGILHGPGVFDMRGGIVAALNAVEALVTLEALERPLVLLLTCDEEVGSRTSEELIVGLGRSARLVLVPEPPCSDGALKTRRKGVSTYRVSVAGRSSHAGLDPERGVSAIHALLDAAQAARALARPELGTTVNVGRIGGGTRANVVAAEAAMEIDVRIAHDAEYDRVEQWFAELAARGDGAAELTVERQHGRPPMERTEAIAEAFAGAHELAATLEMTLREGGAGGVSDANFIARYGVPVIDGLGPRGNGAHALDEHIFVDSLLEQVALIALLAARL